MGGSFSGICRVHEQSASGSGFRQHPVDSILKYVLQRVLICLLQGTVRAAVRPPNNSIREGFLESGSSMIQEMQHLQQQDSLPEASLQPAGTLLPFYFLNLH